MVSQRSRRRGRTLKKHRQEEGEESSGKTGGGVHGSPTEYEESRAQRIKENTERMKSLGIFDLSIKLRSTSSKPSHSLRKSKPVSDAPSNDPPRRSSRLKDVPRVSYSEKKAPKTEEKSVENVQIYIPHGEKPEIYTEEHEKLLGDSKTVWTLFVDGFDADGHRIYDPFNGKSCHQCRQKTLGCHTECSKCQMATGQFCGDCLFTRYGENVTEVNQSPDWVCPVCRGICNCSRCRREKGWQPIGTIYRKIVKLGFKSVAHYLIHTYRGQTSMEVEAAKNLVYVVETHPDDEKEESSGVLSKLPLGGEEKGTEDNINLESDKQYGEGYKDDDADDLSIENASL